MGLGTQMLAWHEDFCGQLADRGFYVIRYDNRDVGRSTHHSDVPPPSIKELLLRRPKNRVYTLDDMADDGVKLLDALGIGAAHVVGASMGGMIAQLMAARHPAACCR
jgi:pimeloyl-ACP methyl ester carboxylesterase